MLVIVRGALFLETKVVILPRNHQCGPFKSIRYSSCLEWRYTYPLLEEAGLEAWAVDILGWGFSDLGTPYRVCHVILLGHCTSVKL